MQAGVSTRPFGLLATLVCFLIFVLVPRGNLALANDSPVLNVLLPRQGASSSPLISLPTQLTATSAAPVVDVAGAGTVHKHSRPPHQAQQQVTSQQQTTQAAAPTPTTPNPNPTTTTTPPNAPASSAGPSSTITSALVTTNQVGQVITSIIIVSDRQSNSAAPSQTSASSSSSPSGSSSVSSSTIIGLSVAAGVAVLGIIGFFVWKFTRKRMGGYDDNEEIKWPELNAHDTAVPLPTNRTGGSGFDTAADGPKFDRGDRYADPYAVPALPHLDPNQPFRDDPNGALYDPYRGPVPQTFDQAVTGEAIPMTQLAGRRSPGPGLAYGGDLGGRASPGPQQGAYGPDFGGRASPGLRAPPYTSGRVSPGPQAGYGNVYGPR
ncbi:hypothetical protein F5148DRAFT_1150955 [Russula earlei]|uniref:Uncharacterized protein n=1 Tax=Russula earlei TaxID=71964 RepID=A0ACC0U255_9AGAM|nr:hypothetical protein F5148DRAFT_1150955 [Russula earlei]